MNLIIISPRDTGGILVTHPIPEARGKIPTAPPQYAHVVVRPAITDKDGKVLVPAIYGTPHEIAPAQYRDETDEEFVHRIAKSIVPEGAPYLIAPASSLPPDRTQRDLWDADFSNPHGRGEAK